MAPRRDCARCDSGGGIVNAKTLDRIMWLAAGVIVVVLLGGLRLAYASGECNGPGACTDDDIIVGGSTVLQSIEGDSYTSKAWALAAPGLPNVAIARCLGSEAWTLLVGGKQKLVLNQVCMAEFYLKVGRYDLAAQALCNQPEILMEYTTEVSCEIDHDFTPIIPEGKDKFSDEITESPEYVAQQQEIEYLQEENASIVGRLDDLTSLLEQAPASASTPIYIQQEQEPQYTDADKAYILGLYADEEPDDE